MNNLEVTVETPEGALFNYVDIDDIVILSGDLFLVSKTRVESETRRWGFLRRKKVVVLNVENNVIAVFASGNWRHVFRKKSETSSASARATVEKVARDSAC